MDDEALVSAFESAELPAAAFTHVEHVRVAWYHLRTLSLADAIGRCSAGIQRFAAAKGATGKYHETVTVAFILLIGERLDGARHLCWRQFAAANPDLFETPSVLSRYYSDELLRSERARRTFVMPDRTDIKSDRVACFAATSRSDRLPAAARARMRASMRKSSSG